MNRDHKQCLSHPNWIKQKEDHVKFMINQKKKRIVKYNKNPKICKNCKSVIPYEKRINNFCSHKCCATFNNAVKFKKYCPVCNIEIKKKNRYKIKCCSRKCSKELAYKLYIEKWKNGEVTTKSKKFHISDHIRKYLKIKYNNKCCLCGWDKINPKTNKCPLEIDHIDGDYSNNKENNLLLVCPNCHSLTPTYKGLNKGNGRHFRMVKYYKNKKRYDG